MPKVMFLATFCLKLLIVYYTYSGSVGRHMPQHQGRLKGKMSSNLILWGAFDTVERRNGSTSVTRGSIPGVRRHIWLEFVIGSLFCSERFFSGCSGFPLSSKTKASFKN